MNEALNMHFEVDTFIRGKIVSINRDVFLDPQKLSCFFGLVSSHLVLGNTTFHEIVVFQTLLPIIRYLRHQAADSFPRNSVNTIASETPQRIL